MVPVIHVLVLLPHKTGLPYVALGLAWTKKGRSIHRNRAGGACVRLDGPEEGGGGDGGGSDGRWPWETRPQSTAVGEDGPGTCRCPAREKRKYALVVWRLWLGSLTRAGSEEERGASATNGATGDPGGDGRAGGLGVGVVV